MVMRLRKVVMWKVVCQVPRRQSNKRKGRPGEIKEDELVIKTQPEKTASRTFLKPPWWLVTEQEKWIAYNIIAQKTGGAKKVKVPKQKSIQGWKKFSYLFGAIFKELCEL